MRLVCSVLFFILMTCGVKSQGLVGRKFEARQALLFDLQLKRQFPGGDLKARFGANSSIGICLTYKTTNNWFLSGSGHFIFGKNVKESGILDSLKGSSGQIIDEHGQFAVIGLDERGSFWNASVGKIIPIWKTNQNSGIFISAGGGFLQHRIRIYSGNSVPQLSSDYKKGYDRLTNGAALVQSAGFRFLDPRKRVNLTVSFEMTEAFTRNRRAYNFDTMLQDDRKRMDLLFGTNISLTIPLYLKKTSDEEFFE